MIYLAHQTGGYHVFQVFDEPAPGETTWDPSKVVALTRAELVRAIHDIDLHTNVVMPDEVDEDPADVESPCDADGYTPEGHAWVPEDGKLVRVVARFPGGRPRPRVGDVITWHGFDVQWGGGGFHSRDPDPWATNEGGACMRVVPA